MKDKEIQILVSFDENYIPPFRVMMRSLISNNPKETFHVWLLHGGLSESALDEVEQFCELFHVEFTAIEVDRNLFQKAPVFKQYPQEMYYRLLAAMVLPQELKRILYLDPDLLVINEIRTLWDMNLNGATFAASTHSWGPEIINDVNKLRLDTNHDYYNTGVILIDLNRARTLINPDEIFSYVKNHSHELILPDQDVFNSLYGIHTKPIDDRIWNYDVRYYNAYLVKSEGMCTTKWVTKNTRIIHFCGKTKPWNDDYTNRFGLLYQHYMNLEEISRE